MSKAKTWDFPNSLLCISHVLQRHNKEDNCTSDKATVHNVSGNVSGTVNIHIYLLCNKCKKNLGAMGMDFAHMAVNLEAVRGEDSK